MRVSKANGWQTTDPQRDALIEAGVNEAQLYEDLASRRKDDRLGLAACLKTLRNLHHLVNTVHDLTARGVDLKVLTGQGVAIDTTAAGELVFGIFVVLAEFERERISERTVAGLTSARARSRVGGRAPFTMTPGKVRLAMVSMGKLETNIGELCKELGISRQTHYRHVSPTGEIRPDGERVLKKK